MVSTFVSSAQASAIKAAPSNRVGLATSTFFIFLDGGIGVGPFILGLLIPMTGYRNLYIIMAVIVLLTLFLYYFLHGKHASKRVESKVMKESSL
ncbi:MULTISPECIES: MFS transporter [Priestia]|uniref:MFS transporter n=1 Tax=Priestia TaxID=2800373 RepID=UPI001FD83FF9|nr:MULTISPECIES: MFS transporter [Priestia]MDN3233163.1 MFS transporter [Priestia megaterium]